MTFDEDRLSLALDLHAKASAVCGLAGLMRRAVSADLADPLLQIAEAHMMEADACPSRRQYNVARARRAAGAAGAADRLASRGDPEAVRAAAAEYQRALLAAACGAGADAMGRAADVAAARDELLAAADACVDACRAAAATMGGCAAAAEAGASPFGVEGLADACECLLADIYAAEVGE